MAHGCHQCPLSSKHRRVFMELELYIMTYGQIMRNDVVVLNNSESRKSKSRSMRVVFVRKNYRKMNF